MPTIDFTSAYYIKLGRGGEWEANSIETGKLRLGWRQQAVEDINAKRWEFIEQQLRTANEGKPRGVATADFNALKIIVESSTDDVWITFHKGRLWWARLANGPIKADETSKYRETTAPWSDRSTDGRLLAINSLPGKIAQLQGFRATACRVKHADRLQRTLNGTRSALAIAISENRLSLEKNLTDAIRELHWKDFETLVDLVFRAAGWVRVSVLGQHAKAYDLELIEPIMGDRYVVQVKSQAGLSELKSSISEFSSDVYRRVFFVVHSPEPDLEAAAKAGTMEHVEIISPQRLGQLALDAGLAKWIADKVD